MCMFEATRNAVRWVDHHPTSNKTKIACVFSFIRATIVSSTLVVCILAPKYFCDDSFEGGGWVLVRRVKQGSTWHPATDNLRGTDVYGSYGTPLSDTTFSISWQGLGTELLITTGFPQFLLLGLVLSQLSRGVRVGDMSLWTVVDSANFRRGWNVNPRNSHRGPQGTSTS
jgi:hypothetical protein